MKKGVLKNFVKFTGKHLCQSLFSIKLKRNSGAVIFQLFFKNTFLAEHIRMSPSAKSSSEFPKIFKLLHSRNSH